MRTIKVKVHKENVKKSKAIVSNEGVIEKEIPKLTEKEDRN